MNGYITSNKEWKIFHPKTKISRREIDITRNYYNKPDFLKYSTKESEFTYATRNVSIIQSYGVLLTRSSGILILAVCENSSNEINAFVNEGWLNGNPTYRASINRFLKEVWELKPKQVKKLPQNELILMFSGYQPGFEDYSEEKQSQLSSEFLNSLSGELATFITKYDNEMLL